MASDWPHTFLQPGCFCLAYIYTYGTAQFKIDTRVQQTRVQQTDFVEAHASYSHAGCMA